MRGGDIFYQIHEPLQIFLLLLTPLVGKTIADDDCRHIATATIYKVDYLVSCNFKHIVNVFSIRGYNAVNLKNGYFQLDIRSPNEIVIYEDWS